MSNKSRLIAALQRELEQVKGLSARALSDQTPSITVAIGFIKLGFLHIQRTVKESSANPWHMVDIAKGPYFFEKAGLRVEKVRETSDFLNFIRSVAHQLQGYDYEDFADEQVMALIGDMVKELDLIIDVKET